MTSLPTRRAGVVLVAALTTLFVLAAPALGHPLGNFTSNTAVRAVVGTDGIDLRYVLDLAEIPTTRYRQEVDRDDDGEVSAQEGDAAAADRCVALLAELAVQVDGTPVEARPTTHDLAFPEGQAGLPTTRLTCDARIDADTEQADITIVDGNLPDRIGWREVTAVGDRVRLVDADVPEASPTRLLREYPDQAASDPLRTTTASLRTRPGGAPAAADAIEGGDPTSDGSGGTSGGDEAGVFERLSLAYTDLVAERELTLGFGLFALVLAMLLGTLHALAPGHGKTVIAAYVVGQRGTARHALGIGAIVAVTHTIGVLLLGLLLSTSEALVPERIYPWLGVLSGALVVWIGAGLVRTALRRRALARARAHEHAHAHAHGHAHDHGGGHDHGHEHGGHHHHHPELGEVDLGWRNLVALGVAGGMAPSPSALLVLLGATALGRTWFGIVLVVAYGVGLAGLLVIGGLLLVRVRGAAERLISVSERPRLQRLTAALPMLTGVAVVFGGFVIAARGFVL